MFKEGAGSYGGVQNGPGRCPTPRSTGCFCPAPVSSVRPVLGLFRHSDYCLIEDTALPHQSFNSEFLQNSATPFEAMLGRWCPEPDLNRHARNEREILSAPSPHSATFHRNSLPMEG